MLVSDADNAALRQAVAEVYERYSQYMDPELQQRAVEYRGLAERPGAAAAALQPLPKWDRKTSLLLRRLAEKEVGRGICSAANLLRHQTPSTGAATSLEIWAGRCERCVSGCWRFLKCRLGSTDVWDGC